MLKTILITAISISTSYAHAYYGNISPESTESYVDRLTGTQRQVNVTDSNGSYSTIHQNTNGTGYVNHSDGSFSTFSR
jgi:hypothetical protein